MTNETPNVTDRLRAAIYGHLVGDAIGVPYEFTTGITSVELRGHGSHNQPAGTWSDDGALMLALLDSMLETGFDPDDQGRRILAWHDDGAYTPDGDGRFDIGNATAQAIRRLKRGVRAVDAGGPEDSDEQGNGSLMRILPLALVDQADGAQLIEHAHLGGRVTHGALACQVACVLYVLIARDLRDTPDADPDRLLADATDRLRAHYDRQTDHGMALETLLLHRGKLRKPGGGWVLDSFWSAWEAFAGGTSYRDVITRAVHYGHDTDTTAAIAGGLAGLRWGLDEAAGGIPAEWLDGLRSRELVETLIGDRA